MESTQVPGAPDGSGAMFDGIAARYDLLNRIMSLGIDQRWRRRTAAALQLKAGQRVLDLATGTGDLAIQVARAAPKVRVVGVDPSAGMLEVGRRKVAQVGLADVIDMQQGDAQQLNFPADSFDGVCMAFGIRNVPDRRAALREMRRVVRPGGRVAILELSEPDGVLGPVARFHVHSVVPAIGSLLSGRREYRYLQESIARFPPPADFADMMQEAGLQVDSIEGLTFGACCLYAAHV